MAMIGLRVPPETAQLLKQIDLKGFGVPEPMDQAHITLLHLGDDVPIESLTEAIRVLYTVASKTRPFAVQTSRATTFPPQDGKKTPMIAQVDSNALHDFHRALQEAFEAAGIDFSKKWPEFKPHVTLGYSKDPLVDADHVFDETFPTVEWGAHEAVLFGGDKGKQTMMVTTPFSLSPFRQAVRQAMFRAANRPYEHDQEAQSEKKELLKKLELLSQAAYASGDNAMASFAESLGMQLERADTAWNFSLPQERKLREGLQQYHHLMSHPAELDRLFEEKNRAPQVSPAEQTRNLRIRINQLLDAAKQDGDNWVISFATNIGNMVRNNRQLSPAQSNALEKAFKKYRL